MTSAINVLKNEKDKFFHITSLGAGALLTITVLFWYYSGADFKVDNIFLIKELTKEL